MHKEVNQLLLMSDSVSQTQGQGSQSQTDMLHKHYVSVTGTTQAGLKVLFRCVLDHAGAVDTIT